MPKLVRIGNIDKEVFIDYFDIEKKVIFSFKCGKHYVDANGKLGDGVNL